jgi:hypothetical protein
MSSVSRAMRKIFNFCRSESPQYRTAKIFAVLDHRNTERLKFLPFCIAAIQNGKN